MTETKFGVPKHAPGYKHRLNPEYIALWESYLDEGMSGQHVAEIFGVTKFSVAKYYPNKVWTNEQSLEHARAIRSHKFKMKGLHT